MVYSSFTTSGQVDGSDRFFDLRMHDAADRRLNMYKSRPEITGPRPGYIMPVALQTDEV